MSTKASDVLELGTARALLGCSSSMSLLDGVRALKADLATAQQSSMEWQAIASTAHNEGWESARRHYWPKIEQLREQHARQANDKGSHRSAEATGQEHRPQEPTPDGR